MAAAQALVRQNPGMIFLYVSGMGTDSGTQGRIMWARVKGRTENALLRMPSAPRTCSGRASSSRCTVSNPPPGSIASSIRFLVPFFAPSSRCFQSTQPPPRNWVAPCSTPRSTERPNVFSIAPISTVWPRPPSASETFVEQGKLIPEMRCRPFHDERVDEKCVFGGG